MGNQQIRSIASFCSGKTKNKVNAPKEYSTNSNNLLTNISKRKDLFEGIVASFNGLHREEWVQISQNIFYKGEWQNQKKHGRGLIYNKKQEYILVGCFYQDNLILNKCKKLYINGKQYQGPLNQQYEMNGKGKVKTTKYKYEGEFKNNKLEGQGKLQTQTFSFKGKFQNGKKVYGLLISSQGTYQGPFVNDAKQGEGIFVWTNAGKYVGPFKNDKINGKGKLYDTEGNFTGYGTFIDGKRLF